MQGLPKRLGDRIDALGLSVNKLAQLSGVDRAVIIRARDGSHVDGMTCATAIRLARALNVSLDWLLCGADGGAMTAATSAPSAIPPTQIVVMVQPGTPQATAEALAQAAQHFAGIHPVPSNQDGGTVTPLRRPNKRGN